jgi:PPE-repeat protein
MRLFMVLLICLPTWALAQGSGSAGSGSAAGSAGSGSAGSGSAGSGSADGSAAGSAGSGSADAGSGAGSASGSGVTEPGPGSAETPPSPATVAARKACAEAMNADPTFADAIVKNVEIQLHKKPDVAQVCKDHGTLEAHQAAQTEIATNERHVIMAYAAMWLIAVGFVLFLWRRQQALKLEIAQLRRDLDAAAKDGK